MMLRFWRASLALPIAAAGSVRLDMRIGHLVIVAGAQAAGKSTFIDDWRAGRLPSECQAVLPDARKWQACNVKKIAALAQQPGSHHRRLIVQYDTMRRLHQRRLENDPVLSIVPAAKTVTIVCLHLPPNELLRRMIARHADRASGGDGRRPSSGFNLRIRALEARAKVSDERRSNRFYWRLLAPNWPSIKAAMRPWSAEVVARYAQEPTLPLSFMESFIESATLRAMRSVTIIPVEPKRNRVFARVGWTLDREEIRRIKPPRKPSPIQSNVRPHSK